MARLSEVNGKAKNIFDKIINRYEASQTFSRLQVRFNVSISTKENLAFDKKIFINKMFLVGKEVLHVVGTASRFFATTFLVFHGILDNQ